MSFDHLVLDDRRLLPERLAAALRKAIVEGSIAPGTRLVEKELAERFNVSRVPLREAFRVLEGEGLVNIHPHRGALISKLSDVEMVELFGVRAIFEAHAAEAVAAARPLAEIEQLSGMVAAMKTAVRAHDLDAYYELAAAFHDALVAASGNGILVRLYSQIKRQLRRYQAAMARLPESPTKSIAEHEAIIRRLDAGDRDGAAAAARQHVTALVERFHRGHKKKTKGTKGAGNGEGRHKQA